MGGFLTAAIIGAIIDKGGAIGGIGLLVGPGVLVLGVIVARLHDLGRSGWWALAPFVAAVIISNTVGAIFHQHILAGSLILLLTAAFLVVLGAAPGDPERNRFGAAPGKRVLGAVFD